MNKMNKSKQRIGLAFILTLCVISIISGAQGQPPQPKGSVTGRTVAPLTAAHKAILDEKSRLDQAAIAASDVNNFAEEEDDARQSLALGVGSGLCQDLLAQALYAQGEDDEALQLYQTMADQGEGFLRNLTPYAVLLLKTGQWAKAVAVYNQVVPRLGDVGHHTETPIIHDSDILQANTHFSPDNPQPKELAVALHIVQGITYLDDPGWSHRSRDEEAMIEFTKALRLAPNLGLSNYYYGAGWQELAPAEKKKIGTAQQAKAALQKALKIGDTDVKKAAEKALKDAG